MVSWFSSIIVAFALLIGGAVYVRFRWQRSPQAYRCDDRACGVLLRRGVNSRCLGSAFRVVEIPTGPNG